jgi:hypothetical protein
VARETEITKNDKDRRERVGRTRPKLETPNEIDSFSKAVASDIRGAIKGIRDASKFTDGVISGTKQTVMEAGQIIAADHVASMLAKPTKLLQILPGETGKMARKDNASGKIYQSVQRSVLGFLQDSMPKSPL